MIIVTHSSHQRNSHLHLAQQYWLQHVKPFHHLVDATAGSGYDTCFLASLLNGQGKITAYDIQALAMEKTQQKLMTHLTNSQREIVSLKLASHEWICENNLALVVYNLGYLPGSDKTCITQVSTTLLSLQRASQALISQGALSIMCYPGHEGGREEQKAILDWAEQLNASLWLIEYHTWPSKGSHAPSWLWIKRRD